MLKHDRIFVMLIVVAVVFLFASVSHARDESQGSETNLQNSVSASASTSDLLAPLGTSFTYQGRLSDSGSPANGMYDFNFKLFDDPSFGVQVGGTLERGNVFVSDGYFTLELDFGMSAFTGEARWLEIGVRPGSSVDLYITLAPRQALTAAPYALSVRPGASISGDVPSSGVLSLTNSDALGMGMLVNAANHGVFVLSAVTNGIVVQSAGNDGVYIDSTGDDGVSIGQAGDVGVYVGSTINDGIYVNAAGNRGIYVASAVYEGVRVGSTDSDGVVVDSAGQVGIYVRSAHTGMRVNTTTLEGLLIASAGTSGMKVINANEDGVQVVRAGNPSLWTSSDAQDGFEVQGAQGNGLFVGRADEDGVVVNAAGDDGVSVGTVDDNGLYVEAAGGDGVQVISASNRGVYVGSAGMHGVRATTTNASYYGGQFINAATGGIGLYALGGSNTAPDLVLGGTSTTNDDGRIYSDPAYASSDLMLVSNDAVQIELDNDNDESGDLWVLNGANTTVFALDESGNLTAIGTKSAQVNTKDFGQRKLYAVESPENWFEDFGTAELVGGQASVMIEPVFAQTVNLTERYHVFLTPLGDCPLYVAEKTPASFTVRAMGGLACEIAFDYRIIARRLGYETIRLEAGTMIMEEVTLP